MKIVFITENNHIMAVKQKTQKTKTHKHLTGYLKCGFTLRAANNCNYKKKTNKHCTKIYKYIKNTYKYVLYI